MTDEPRPEANQQHPQESSKMTERAISRMERIQKRADRRIERIRKKMDARNQHVRTETVSQS